MTARIVEASPVVHRLKRGLDLPLAGAPVQAVEPAGPTRLVGVLGDDWHGLKPTFQVQPGQRVRRGDLLFEDKTRPGVRHTLRDAPNLEILGFSGCGPGKYCPGRS